MLTTVLIWIAIGIIFIGVGIACIVKMRYNGDALGPIAILIGFAFILIGGVYWSTLMVDRNHEQGIYQQYMVEARDLEAALSSADNVVTAELYTKAIEFNIDLTYQQYLYERGGYIAISGEYDWSAIPLVTIPQ